MHGNGSPASTSNKSDSCYGGTTSPPMSFSLVSDNSRLCTQRMSFHSLEQPSFERTGGDEFTLILLPYKRPSSALRAGL